jgi:hypothetical protein
MMKNNILVFTFMILLFSIAILNVLTPPTMVSFAERRELHQFEDLKLRKLLTGDFLEDFDQAALDQFILRDQFRRIKARVENTILHKNDNNDIVVRGEDAFKLEYPLNEESVVRFSAYINTITALYLDECQVFFAMIPDKNYYVQSSSDFLSMDYQKMESLLHDSINGMTLIDLKDVLSLTDYYRTDPHWKQQNLDGVLERLREEMNLQTDFSSIATTTKQFAPFYGAYYGQSALNLAPDTIEYRVSESIENAIVKNFDYTGDLDQAPGVYDEQKLGQLDSYDLFLSGSTPLLTIENPNSTRDKELIIFRDSFASSLAPLLIEEYQKITLIDLRYVSHELISDFVDFEGSDVLFLYSTLVINHSEILK